MPVHREIHAGEIVRYRLGAPFRDTKAPPRHRLSNCARNDCSPFHVIRYGPPSLLPISRFLLSDPKIARVQSVSRQPSRVMQSISEIVRVSSSRRCWMRPPCASACSTHCSVFEMFIVEVSPLSPTMPGRLRSGAHGRQNTSRDGTASHRVFGQQAGSNIPEPPIGRRQAQTMTWRDPLVAGRDFGNRRSRSHRARLPARAPGPARATCAGRHGWRLASLAIARRFAVTHRHSPVFRWPAMPLKRRPKHPMLGLAPWAPGRQAVGPSSGAARAAPPRQ